MAIADKHGYRPNRAAEFLRRGSAASIGAFIPRSPNRLHGDLVIGLADAAGAKGFPLNLSFGVSLRSYRSFIERKSDIPHSGIVTYPYENAGPAAVRAMQRFRDAGGKLVVLNSQHIVENAPSVSIDDISGGVMVAEHLLSLDPDRIFTFGYYGIRNEAFVEAVESAGMQVRQLKGDEKGLSQLMRSAKRGGRIAVFAAADHYALDIYRLFFGTRFSIGKEVLVVGYDDLVLAEKVTPKLTTIHQPTNRLGLVAIEKIVDLIYGKTVESELIKPRLILRESA